MITADDTDMMKEALAEMRRFYKQAKLSENDQSLLQIACLYCIWAKLYQIDCATTALARNVSDVRAAIDRYPAPPGS